MDFHASMLQLLGKWERWIKLIARTASSLPCILLPAVNNPGVVHGQVHSWWEDASLAVFWRLLNLDSRGPPKELMGGHQIAPLPPHHSVFERAFLGITIAVVYAERSSNGDCDTPSLSYWGTLRWKQCHWHQQDCSQSNIPVRTSTDITVCSYNNQTLCFTTFIPLTINTCSPPVTLLPLGNLSSCWLANPTSHTNITERGPEILPYALPYQAELLSILAPK